MEILIIAVFIGLIPAAIASSRGHSFLLWWLFGAGLFIVALPCALFLKDPKKEAAEANREAVRDAALAALVANSTVAAGHQARAGVADFNSGSSDLRDTRKCNWCAETIKAEAVVCRFCNRDVVPLEQPA